MTFRLIWRYDNFEGLCCRRKWYLINHDTTYTLWFDTYLIYQCRRASAKHLTFQWRHNERDGVSITGISTVYSTVCSEADQPKTPKPRGIRLCEGNLPVTGGFPAQRASNVENVSMWLRHHDELFSTGLSLWNLVMFEIQFVNIWQHTTEPMLYAAASQCVVKYSICVLVFACQVFNSAEFLVSVFYRLQVTSWLPWGYLEPYQTSALFFHCIYSSSFTS